MTEYRSDNHRTDQHNAGYGSEYRKRSIGGQVSSIMSEAIDLARGEIALARTEASEKMSIVVAALVGAVLGTALIMAALVILMQAVVVAIASYGVHPGWAAAIVGGVSALIGVVLLMSAKSKLQAKNFAPDKTLNQLRKDRETIQEVRS